MLCLEGLAQALRIFGGLDPIPTYKVANVGKESMLEMRVGKEVRLDKAMFLLSVCRPLNVW